MSPSHYDSQATSEISQWGFHCNQLTAVHVMNTVSVMCYQCIFPLPYRTNY